MTVKQHPFELVGYGEDNISTFCFAQHPLNV